jgi:hypothetical protein
MAAVPNQPDCDISRCFHRSDIDVPAFTHGQFIAAPLLRSDGLLHTFRIVSSFRPAVVNRPTTVPALD